MLQKSVWHEQLNRGESKRRIVSTAQITYTDVHATQHIGQSERQTSIRFRPSLLQAMIATHTTALWPTNPIAVSADAIALRRCVTKKST